MLVGVVFLAATGCAADSSPDAPRIATVVATTTTSTTPTTVPLPLPASTTTSTTARLGVWPVSSPGREQVVEAPAPFSLAADLASFHVGADRIVRGAYTVRNNSEEPQTITFSSGCESTVRLYREGFLAGFESKGCTAALHDTTFPPGDTRRMFQAELQAKTGNIAPGRYDLLVGLDLVGTVWAAPLIAVTVD